MIAKFKIPTRRGDAIGISDYVVSVPEKGIV